MYKIKPRFRQICVVSNRLVHILLSLNVRRSSPEFQFLLAGFIVKTTGTYRLSNAPYLSIGFQSKYVSSYIFFSLQRDLMICIVVEKNRKPSNIPGEMEILGQFRTSAHDVGFERNIFLVFNFFKQI